MLFSPHLEFNDILDRDETIVWSGTPKSGIILRSQDIFTIPFSLLWCGIVIFIYMGSLQTNNVFSIVGIPFVLIGLFMVFGRFFLDAKQRSNTIYGITQNRVIIKSGIFSKKIQSININTLSNLELLEKNDGSGTIVLGPKDLMFDFRAGGLDYLFKNEKQKISPKLDLIENAKMVYIRIVKIQNG